MANIIAGDSMFSIEDFLHDPGPAQACLASIHATHTPAQCTCQRDRRQIVVRRLANHYVLACWPDDGPNHHVSCYFYRPVSSASPEQRPPSHTQIDHVPASHGLGVHHRSSPATLMHDLLHRAGLGTWGPGLKRDWWHAQRSLTAASNDIHWGKATLGECFFAPQAFRPDRISELRLSWSRFRDALAPGKSGVICGELKSVTKHDGMHEIYLAHHAVPVCVPSHQFIAIQASSPLAIGLLDVRRDYRCRILGLLFVEGLADGNVICVDGFLQLTNQAYVPVNNVHDLQLANHLCACGRMFERGQKGDQFNYLLTDTKPPTPLVVSGGATVAARSRHRDRVLACANRSPAVWEWDAALTATPPPLPTPTAS